MAAFKALSGYEGDAAFEADVAIVGAGAAGITLARELIGKGLRVLLIESGGLDLDGATQELADGESVGLTYEPLVVSRLRYFGGTTNHWTGWSRPLDLIDFKPRPWLGIDGWPFGLDELTPYYEQAQAICELGPYRYDRSIWSIGGEVPDALDPGRFEEVYWTRSPPTLFGLRYRGEIEAAPNVDVLLEANLTRIGLDPATGEVSGLDLSALNGRKATVKARRYVLACGGIDNPRALLASNDVRPNGIGNEHDLVGRYFMEHPHWVAGEIVSDDPYPLIDRSYKRITGGLLRRMGWTFREATQETMGTLNCSVALEVEVDNQGSVAGVGAMWKDLRQGQIPDHLGSRVGAALGNLGGVFRGAWRKHVAGTFVNRPVQWIGLNVSLDPLPLRDSRVTLGPGRDALGVPLPRLDWRLDPADGRSVAQLARLAAAEVTRLGAGRVKLHPDLADESGTWISRWNLVGHDEVPDAPTSYISWHHMGTTRMATDPARGVVDANSRVHGTPNLYVTGASVFPTVGHGNPTLTIVALAVRLARHLEGEFTG